jgi:MFS family permease
MYQVANSQIVAQGSRALLRRRSGGLVSRTVVLLGLTSLFTDVSSEMVTAILPLYLVYSVGLSPLQFGVIDGIQQGASALVRIAGGFFADRLRRYKEVAAVGYGVSAVCRIGFLAAGSAWGAIGAVMFADRMGKGIRTGPRDAMISLSTPPERLGAAFGVHRALDTAGATIGPLVAFGLLVAVPHGFHSVFVVSFCFAIVGLAILVLFVRNPREDVAPPPAPAEPVTLRAVARLLAIPRFPTVIVVGSMLALTTMSDGFVYLALQKSLGFAGHQLPLLYVATSLVYMLLAAPVGRLADRVGRGHVLVGGYALLLIVYASLLLPPAGLGGIVLVIVAFGTYYAATDGVLMALASPLLPPELRASGLSLVVTATSLARLLASIAFGATWAIFGIGAAVVVFGAGLALATVAAAIALSRISLEAVHAS